MKEYVKDLGDVIDNREEKAHSLKLMSRDLALAEMKDSKDRRRMKDSRAKRWMF